MVFYSVLTGTNTKFIPQRRIAASKHSQTKWIWIWNCRCDCLTGAHTILCSVFQVKFWNRNENWISCSRSFRDTPTYLQFQLKSTGWWICIWSGDSVCLQLTYFHRSAWIIIEYKTDLNRWHFTKWEIWNWRFISNFVRLLSIRWRHRSIRLR